MALLYSNNGFNFRITSHTNQGGRPHNEDTSCIGSNAKNDGTGVNYIYGGVFDGHGGDEASVYTKENIVDNIVHQENFSSSDDNSILKAIKDGFIKTHYDMWKTLETWPNTRDGLPSTAGTTATIGFIKQNKMFIGHVGDSAAVLGFKDPFQDGWKHRRVTTMHKPDNVAEFRRIIKSGGATKVQKGTTRVVWKRTIYNGQKIVRKDEVPFLAMSRSLGDFWSYNRRKDLFIVSPEPDCSVIPIDLNSRCLIFGSDGLWDVVNPQEAVNDVFSRMERHNQSTPHFPNENSVNPSKNLVDLALRKWAIAGIDADNITVVTVIIDQPQDLKEEVEVQPKVTETTSEKVESVAEEVDKANIDDTIDEKQNGLEEKDVAVSISTDGSVEVYMIEEDDEDVMMPTKKEEQEILADDDDKAEIESGKPDVIEAAVAVKVNGAGKGAVVVEADDNKGVKRKAEEELQGSARKVTFLETKVPFLKKCQELTAGLMSSEFKAFAWPFLEPFNVNRVNRLKYLINLKYLETAENPIDLSTVKTNVDAAVYKTPEEYAVDVRLIFTNCYNCCEAGSEVYKLTQELEKVFEEKFKLLQADEKETASAANTDADGAATA